MTELKNTTVNLEDKHFRWIDKQGRDFNFSEWVRSRIDRELTTKGK